MTIQTDSRASVVGTTFTCYSETQSLRKCHDLIEYYMTTPRYQSCNVTH